jgi:uncharacterized protein YjbI with pentapeptide repeats
MADANVGDRSKTHQDLGSNMSIHSQANSQPNIQPNAQPNAQLNSQTNSQPNTQANPQPQTPDHWPLQTQDNRLVEELQKIQDLQRAILGELQQRQSLGGDPACHTSWGRQLSRFVEGLPFEPFLDDLAQILQEFGVFKIALLGAGILGAYMVGADMADRRDVKFYSAWSIINGNPPAYTDSGRVKALEDLHKAGFNFLAHGDFPKAYLRELDLGEKCFQLWNDHRFCYRESFVLNQANLEEADLQMANLQGALLNGTNLKQANLKLAKLQGVALASAQLQRADLQQTQLQDSALAYADFTGASLTAANFQNAKVNEAIFQDSILLGADFTGTNLQPAQVATAYLCATVLPQDWPQDWPQDGSQDSAPGSPVPGDRDCDRLGPALAAFEQIPLDQAQAKIQSIRHASSPSNNP